MVGNIKNSGKYWGVVLRIELISHNETTRCMQYRRFREQYVTYFAELVGNFDSE